MRAGRAPFSSAALVGAARGAFAWSAAAALVASAMSMSAAFRAPPVETSDGEGVRIAPPVCRIDLSTAPVEELALLPEVGPQLAARIAADRAIHGPFRSVDELTRVPGFGERRIAELRDSARATTP
jgi:competence protein ComEA